MTCIVLLALTVQHDINWSEYAASSDLIAFLYNFADSAKYIVICLEE